MMQARKSWKISKLSLLISSIVLIGGCSLFKPKERVVTQIQLVERDIPVRAHPHGLTLYETTFYAVTADTYAEFAERFTKENGDLVYFAISVPGYENLALSLADIKRYIEQQQAIILYYETQVTPREKEEVEAK